MTVCVCVCVCVCVQTIEELEADLEQLQGQRQGIKTQTDQKVCLCI